MLGNQRLQRGKLGTEKICQIPCPANIKLAEGVIDTLMMWPGLGTQPPPQLIRPAHACPAYPLSAEFHVEYHAKTTLTTDPDDLSWRQHQAKPIREK